MLWNLLQPYGEGWKILTGQINAIKNSQQAQRKIIFVKLPGKHSIQALADVKIYLALGFHAIDTNK